MPKTLTIELPMAEQLKFNRWVEREKKLNSDNLQRLMVTTRYRINHIAQMMAPVNYGFLKASINSAMQPNRLGFVFSAGGMSRGVNVRYAPYKEFGTGTKVQIPTNPEGLHEYAIQFKGKGIRKVNIKAHPYFFPAVRIGMKEMIARLNQMGFK